MTQDDITKKNEAFWDSMAGRYDRYFWFTRWTQRKLVAGLDLHANPRVLDLACGTGWAVIYAHDRARGRGEFHGLDISQAMIGQSERNSGARKGLQFHRANAEDIPLSDGIFDYVISSNAFHHFADPVKVLKESRRVLKAGGSVRILDETADNPAAKWIDHLMGRVEQGHVRLYSTREFIGFFDQAGFNYVSTLSVLPAVKIHVALKE